MIYFIFLPLNLICMILSYITNPLVVLFADNRGELHGLWRYWQTWDDSLDVEWFVKTRVPLWLRYDFDKHYISSRETTPELARVGRDKGCVIVKDGDFTRHERWQRYWCRVLWLTRNSGYGFAMWLFGCTVCGDEMRMHIVIRPDREFVFGYASDCNILMRPWILYIDWPIIGGLRWNIFLGWKIDYTSGCQIRQAMIANRVSIRIARFRHASSCVSRLYPCSACISVETLT